MMNKEFLECCVENLKCATEELGRAIVLQNNLEMREDSLRQELRDHVHSGIKEGNLYYSKTVDKFCTRDREGFYTFDGMSSQVVSQVYLFASLEGDFLFVIDWEEVQVEEYFDKYGRRIK